LSYLAYSKIKTAAGALCMYTTQRLYSGSIKASLGTIKALHTNLLLDRKRLYEGSFWLLRLYLTSNELVVGQDSISSAG
jgi:hypothetical protein